jgi:hypothetical protein
VIVIAKLPCTAGCVFPDIVLEQGVYELAIAGGPERHG